MLLVIIFVICFSNFTFAKTIIYPETLDIIDDPEKVVSDIYNLIENGVNKNTHIMYESYLDKNDIKTIVDKNILMQNIGDSIVIEAKEASKLNIKATLMEVNKYYYSEAKKEVLAVGIFKVGVPDSFSSSTSVTKQSFNFNKLVYNIKLNTSTTKDLYIPFLFISSEINKKTEGLLLDKDSTLFKNLDEYHNSNLYKLINGKVSSIKQTDVESDGLSSWALSSKYYIDRYTPKDLLNNYKANITRKEFAKLAVSVYIKIQEDKITKLSDQKPIDFNEQLVQKFEETYIKSGRKYQQNVFSDTNDYHVELAYAFGIVNGFAGFYYPDNNISREEASVMIYNIVKLLDINANRDKKIFKDVEPSSFAFDSISNLSAISTLDGNAIMQGISEDLFDPKGLYTREQAFVTMSKLVKALYKS